MCALTAVVMLSLAPAPDLPPVPQGFDKLEHFLAYALLSAMAVQLFGTRLALFAACVGLDFLGIGMEHAQAAWTQTRMMDAADALANGIGVLAGLASVLTRWRDALLRYDDGRRQS